MRWLLAAALVLGSTLPVAAQRAPRRAFVAVLAGLHTPAADFDDRFRFEQYFEHATVDVDYPARAAVLVEAGAGVRLWRSLGTGVAVTYFVNDSSAHVHGSIPHPFHFEQLRNISGQRSGLTRRGTAVHLQLRYSLPLTQRLQLVVAAGPSFFSIERELVTGVQFDENYPFDEATFRAADTKRARGTASGFNVGADAVWPMGRRFGVGGILRFFRSSVDLDPTEGRTVTVEADNVQAAFGLRVFF
jgi:hypothetical protein